MKFLFLFTCLPFFSTAQLPGRPDDSLRKMAATMHYPAPFAFKTSAATSITEVKLFNSCYAWLGSVRDSLQGIQVQKDAVHKKITAGNVPATADISYTIVITVKGKGYTIFLQDYIYHSINGKRLPVEKAATIKEYKDPVNIERVLIMHNYPLTFRALADYLEKSR